MTPPARRAPALVYACVLLTAASTGVTVRAAPDDSDVDRLVKQLGSEDFNEREAATRALRRIGPSALAPIERAAAGSKDAEVRRRAAELLQLMTSGEWPREFVEELHGQFRRYDYGAVLHVNLSGTQARDEDLTFLNRLDGLQYLHLGSTPVTDAGLAHVARMKNLFFLDLSNTRVTDEGLKFLRGLAALRVLDLSGTGVTERGVAELRQALPGLNIHHTK
jgi:hypothetical protein